MQTLYDCTKLNDLAVRLRFLTARQVELAMKGLFDGAIAYPFGSSVNGCGKMGCDLDLVLRLSREEQKVRRPRYILPGNEELNCRNLTMAG